jgi:sulfate adenylyltransferase subunit 1 (EFTu-like GTPase family)
MASELICYCSDNMRFIVDEITKIPDEGKRSLVLYGEIERGTLRKGMTVHLEILGQSFTVQSIVADNERPDQASTGQQVGVVLAGLQNVRVQLGEVLVEAAEDGV